MNGSSPSSCECYYRYWGKSRTDTSESGPSYHLLVYHCLDVAAVGWTLLREDRRLCERFSRLFPFSEDETIRIVAFLLAVHDLGKCSVRFQNLAPELLSELQDSISEKGYPERHDRMGQSLLERRIWPLIWSEDWFGLDRDPSVCDAADWKGVWLPCLRAVGGHHGTPRPELPALETYFDPADLAGAEQMAHAFATLLELPMVRLPLQYDDIWEDRSREASWILAGFVVLCDWIGSNTEAFDFHAEQLQLSEYWTIALQSARDALDRFGLIPSGVDEDVDPGALTGGRSLRPMQQAVSTCRIAPEPQLFIIEDVTGSGKTEAALILVHRLMAAGCADGLFFGLPTMATANAMFERMAGTYTRLFDRARPPYVALAHSRAGPAREFGTRLGEVEQSPERGGYAPSEETASVDRVTWLADSRKKALLAQVGVGTIDQALMAILPFRHQSLRLLGLARHVLIVDEVHAYDPYMRQLLQVLLRFQGALGGSAVLLSATIPLGYRRQLVNSFLAGVGAPETGEGGSTEYPLLTQCGAHVGLHYHSTAEELERPGGDSRRVEIELVHEQSQVIEELRNAVAAGGCACYICNTVGDAQAAHAAVSAAIPDAEVLLFHARYALGDRLDLEKEVLRLFGRGSTPEERRGRILVATQVVEQSLDLDFDLMATDLAPIDLVIQRAGRLHRHDRGDRGPARLVVLVPPLEDEPAANWYASLFPRAIYVYPFQAELWLTARLLFERRAFVMPDDARDLIEGVFAPEARQAVPAVLIASDLRAEGEARAQGAIGAMNSLDLRRGYRYEGGAWEDETMAFTRLTEPSTTFLLARWDGATLTPWSRSERDDWSLCRITVQLSTLARPGAMPTQLRDAVETATAKLPDQGRWQTILPLAESGGVWSARGQDRRGRPAEILYDSVRGLVKRDVETS